VLRRSLPKHPRLVTRLRPGPCRGRAGGQIPEDGAQAHPPRRHPTRAALALLGIEAIQWNFTKFLVNRQGEVVRRHVPPTAAVEPARDIESLPR